MKVLATKTFIRSAKAIAKKYRSFNSDFHNDFQNLVSELENNPAAGVDLGNGFRKVRMAITSKGKGKSGGCRVITLDLVERNGCLYLMYIYDKSDYENIALSAIKEYASDMGLL